MTRRWSLIAAIVALAIALTFVLVNLGSGSAAGRKTAGLAATSTASAPSTGFDLKGVGWWPLHEKAGTTAADLAGQHPAKLVGGASWSDGPWGRTGLRLDGHTGWVDTGASVVDTTNGDFSAAAWVRLETRVPGYFYTAVSEDGDQSSAFFLQYCGDVKAFSFSFANTRALATSVGDPKQDRWYHLVGTYSHKDGMLRIYVDGAPAGSLPDQNPEVPSGHLVIGRAKYQGKGTDFWNGNISDVHVYNRALSPAEVTTLAAHEPS